MLDIGDLIQFMELAGVFVFGLSGAMLAVRRRLDMFGVLVLAGAAALAGGVARDLLIGAVPPLALSNTNLLAMALASGIVAFFAHGALERIGKPVMVLDAIGLGLFSVASCDKALGAGLGPLPAMLIGVLSAIGGGALRDILVAEVPRVLREEIYAVAALLGAAIVVLGDRLHLPDAPVFVTGAVAAFLLRVVSVWRNWHAPRAPGS